MSRPQFAFNAQVERYPGLNGWHFVRIGPRQSKTIRQLFQGFQMAGGSLPVTASINNTTWLTSIFWLKAGFYMLAIKAATRKKENIQAGDSITVRLEIRGV